MPRPRMTEEERRESDRLTAETARVTAELVSLTQRLSEYVGDLHDRIRQMQCQIGEDPHG